MPRCRSPMFKWMIVRVSGAGATRLVVRPISSLHQSWSQIEGQGSMVTYEGIGLLPLDVHLLFFSKFGVRVERCHAVRPPWSASFQTVFPSRPSLDHEMCDFGSFVFRSVKQIPGSNPRVSPLLPPDQRMSILPSRTTVKTDGSGRADQLIDP